MTTSDIWWAICDFNAQQAAPVDEIRLSPITLRRLLSGYYGPAPRVTETHDVALDRIEIIRAGVTTAITLAPHVSPPLTERT